VALVKGFVKIPNAELDMVPFCGADNERALVQAAGKEDRIPHRKGLLWWFWQLVHPELPVAMQHQLEKYGYTSKREYVLLDDRLDSLHERLARTSVVIWIRQNDWMPIALHMVTVLGYDPETKKYLVMNDQKHERCKRSYTPGLPAGNVVWDEEKLLRRWCNASWRKNAVLLWLK
jgi:hypothetical protein